MRSFFFVLVSVIVFMFSSCRPQRAIVNYLEDMRDTSARKTFYVTEPIIQKNDLLSIQVYSASLDPQIDLMYNLNMQNNNSSSQNSQLYGYLVDQKGNVELPRIGVVKAEGLTKEQLADNIKVKLKGQLTDPSIIIRFMNFRVIVVGEVGQPGVKTVNVENLTLLEALAMAGDITLFGKKNEVKVLRENNGQREMGIVDVSSTKMFESPYYQLQQNDVVLVEATRYKVRQAEQTRVSQQIGFALSVITSIALLYNIFK